MKTLLFATVGLYIDKHPIFEVASKFMDILSIDLFYSDEPSPKDRPRDEWVDENIEHIRNHFGRMHSVPLPISERGFDISEVQENAFEMAISIINAVYNKRSFDKLDIVLDISAGRVPLSLALSRAGEIVSNYFASNEQDVNIYLASRPRDYPSVILSEIKDYHTPTEKDLPLLKYLGVTGYQSQTRMYQDLNWKNQGEVSKALKRLRELGYYDDQRKEITKDGKMILKLLLHVPSALNNN